MLSTLRTLAVYALCFAVMFGNDSVVFAQTATSGVDTNQSTLPFSISGTPIMTLSTAGLTFNTASGIPLSFGTGFARTGAPGSANILRLYDAGSSSYGFGVSSGLLNIVSGGNTAMYAGNGTVGLYIASNGNVAINDGAVSPSYGLQVGGNIGVVAITGVAPSITLGAAPALTAASATTLSNLQGVGACNTNIGANGTSASALAITGVSGSGVNTVVSFACETIADITGVGTTTVPTCTAVQSLNFDGTKFYCVANPTVPKCTAGQVLTANGTTYSCVANPAPTSCASGQVLTSNGTSFSCVAVNSMPNCGPNQIVGTDASGAPACLNAPPVNNGQALYVSNSNAVTVASTYNKYIYLGVGGTGASTATNRGTLAQAEQQFYTACSITGEDDGTLNTKISTVLCTQVFCGGYFPNVGPILMSQATAVCNSTQAEPGIICQAANSTYPHGTMYLTMACLYAGQP